MRGRHFGHLGFVVVFTFALLVLRAEPAQAKKKGKPPANVFVSGMIWSKAGSILMLERAEDYSGTKTGKDMWDLPGGKPDAGEDLKATATRQVKEETGLDISNWRIVDALNFEIGKGKGKNKGSRRVEIFYEASVPAEAAAKLSDQHKKFQWVKPSEFSNLAMLEPIKKFLQDHQKAGGK